MPDWEGPPNRAPGAGEAKQMENSSLCHPPRRKGKDPRDSLQVFDYSEPNQPRRNWCVLCRLDEEPAAAKGKVKTPWLGMPLVMRAHIFI